MPVTINMQAPLGLLGQTLSCRSGNTYNANTTTGVIANVSAQDVNDLDQMGCITLAPIGSSTGGVIAPSGDLYAGVYAQTALNPTATGGDYVVAVYSLPANSFDGLGVGQRGISISSAGFYAANTNAKRIKIWFNPSAAVLNATVAGGTLVADSASQTQSGVGWRLSADVFHLGAAGSNTQMAVTSGILNGTTVGASGIPAFPTATENSAILVALTANATTAVTDVDVNLFRVVGIN